MKEKSRDLLFWIFGVLQMIILFIFLFLVSLRFLSETDSPLVIISLPLIFSIVTFGIEWLIYSKK